MPSHLCLSRDDQQHLPGKGAWEDCELATGLLALVLGGRPSARCPGATWDEKQDPTHPTHPIPTVPVAPSMLKRCPGLEIEKPNIQRPLPLCLFALVCAEAVSRVRD